ncbi:MAG: 16S rRNA (guanine(527)-N(7))-methyltransferase RsmG [Nitrosomonas sp.]|nr:16S rRNA (guanine(527)-N(7))-methyltransferase RsmG [Nitrosomonas sp.]MBK7365955.1 16S rRNA (guanine(527)-N(7))-methyltransferase RsmG [Nitrosomonas sp.]
MNLEKQLLEGLEAINCGTSDRKALSHRLLQYTALIEKWSQVHNITAVRKPEEMINKHLLDSLVLLPHIIGQYVADVGSGAGLPGIPLAIANPDLRVTVIESNQKKIAFLDQARLELALNNVKVIPIRVEKYFPTQRYDTVVSRAFSDLATFVKSAQHLCVEDGKSRLVAMKGRFPDAELMQLPETCIVERVIRVNVPGLRAARHLIIIKPEQLTH